MKDTCAKIKKILAEGGPPALANDESAVKHVEECPSCFSFLEAISEIEEALDKQPIFDAPDETVDRVLMSLETSDHSVESIEPEKKSELIGMELPIIFEGLDKFLKRNKRTVLVAASVFFIVVVMGFVSTLYLPYFEMAGSLDDGEWQLFPQSSVKTVPAAPEPSSVENEKTEHLKTVTKGKKSKKKRKYKPAKVAKSLEKEMNAPADAPHSGLDGSNIFRRQTPEEQRKNESKQDAFAADESVEADRSRKAATPKNVPKPLLAATVRDFDDSDAKLGKTETLLNGLIRKDAFENTVVVSGKDKVGRKSGGISGRPASKPRELSKQPEKKGAGHRAELLEEFLLERSVVEGLAFKDAEGYWANTYVPGDPAFRWLESRLRSWDREPLFAETGKLALENAARKPFQPFDPPDNAAIGLYLGADTNAVREKSRVLIQVGLMGTPRFSGSRPAMNVGVVLDLGTGLPKDEAAGFRALLLAFARAKDMGDRFSLTVAGLPGGLLIEPGNFNYGHVSLAIKRLFDETSIEGKALSLPQAVRTATETVGRADDPTAPLGSSVVVIVTSRPLGGVTGTLSAMAHGSAVAGIPVSGIGIGSRVRMEELDRIVLSGQGNRRKLENPSDAERLVERELSAVSRVVARTVRLRIRLAPGVELVDVIGSERLDEVRAERVREAEKSIDLRMARNLGIQSDRGEDEDGIQIVIPNFYAGDSHAILLDAVVPGPGPVADVTVRFKDLVKLKNGTVRANLDLRRGEKDDGPLERSVVKNYLAFRLSKALAKAGDTLARGDDAGANKTVLEYMALFRALRENVPGYSRDPDLAADIAMLNEYLTVFDYGKALAGDQRAYIIDSFRLAGKLKVLPRPPGE